MHDAISSTGLAAVSSIARYYTPKRPSKVGTCAGGCWWRTATTIELTPVARATEGSALDKRSEMCKLLVWQHPKKSLHSRTHTTSSNEGRRPRGAFCGSVASGRGGVVRDFEDVVDGLYRNKEAFDGHHWDNQRAA